MTLRTHSISSEKGQIQPTSPPEDILAILSVAQSFLAAIRKKSRAEFEKCCFPAGGMSLSGPGPTPLRFVSMNSYINWITAAVGDFDERMWNPRVQVYEGGNLATVWAPFRAKINGRLNHIGVDLFIMHKIDGRWKISGLADSCRHLTDGDEELD
ncbi:hypothetical protein Egran_01588 [Elaphomyces granulatus]|jgi:hypothetical protein|uniref:SnoaL-like domain-containing protein n=1 Tax=Elaphomyces granulatus TaxID=519963 RepID=A0A232M2U4_9EURO|nr:hypothetical protein Egran_01588 [Elaphomyces granulatus]